MTCSLSSLSTELVEHITSFLLIPDLSHLRLTCHALETKSHRIFGLMGISSLKVIISDETSMQTLIEIASDPAFFQFIRRIDFAIGELCDDRQDFHKRNAARTEGGIERSHVGLVEGRRQRRMFLMLKAKEMRYREGKDAKDFEDVFRRLRNEVVVGLTEDFSRAIGMKRLERMLGYHGPLVSKTSMTERCREVVDQALGSNSLESSTAVHWEALSQKLESWNSQGEDC